MNFVKSFAEKTLTNFLGKLTLFLLVVCFLLPAQTTAQPDASFGTNGVAKTDVFNYDLPFGLFVLPDQKILVVNRGQVSDSGQRKYYFLRYNSNGTPDTTFGTNGVRELAIPHITRLDLQRAIRQPEL